MKKHLKYIDGNSDKFWQIEVIENEFTVTYGKNGTSGVSQTKLFETNEKCMQTAEKLLAEKIKKGYSENGEVLITKTVIDSKGNKVDISEILNEYDLIISKKDSSLLLPFLIKNSKGNLEHIRKHIKKNKKYWLTYVDLSLESWYKKITNNNWHWGIRGDDKIKEIITLSAIGTFDKTDILSFDEVKDYLEKANEPIVFEIIKWANPNWIEFYILDRLRKNDWLSFNYNSLRFLEENKFINYNSELYALSFSRFNSWHGNIKPREFIKNIVNDTIAYERDIPLLFEYETNIQNSTFNETPNAGYREFNTWNLIFLQLIQENKLDKQTFIENAILIQTKDWNNNLKLFFRTILEELNLESEDLITYQEQIFTFFHNSNTTIVNFGLVLLKKIYEHPKFKTKSFLEWIEALMMRNDCKTTIKSTLIIFEKLIKKNPKLAPSIASIIVDIYVIPDLALHEKVSKLLLKIGNPKDKALCEKISNYVSFTLGNTKTTLSVFLKEEDLVIDNSNYEMYEYINTKSTVLNEKVTIPINWNEILFLISRIISQDDILEEEILINVFIAQLDLFPVDYSKQLQPYLKQIENVYYRSIHKSYIRTLLANKINNKKSIFKLIDDDLTTLNTLKLPKYTIQKAIEKNKINSKIPLLSFPTHKPYWVEPKTLLQRIIDCQNNKEEIDLVDLSIAISRMPRENIEEAIPLLDQISEDLRDLMSYCLGVTSQINFDSNSKISSWFKNIIGQNVAVEKIALWAVAARTFYPDATFKEFEKSSLNDVPYINTPFIADIKFKEKWNEYKNYTTNKMERSTSWYELSFALPKFKDVPKNFIYNLDLHPKTERYSWFSDYILSSEANVYYWNSIMPQNNQPLALQILKNSCKTSEGTSDELKGFLNVMNMPFFKYDEISMLVFSCCFFQEKKDIRILASEVLVQLVSVQNIDIELFTNKMNFLISNKYGVFQRFIDGIIAIKDISPLHNSALYLILEGIFSKIDFKDKLPTNFKKLVENYTDILVKTNQKPTKETISFFEKYKESSTLKSLIKQIITL